MIADQIVNFSAYSVQDIVAILNEKFNGFEKSALEYCARKVAAVDGDLRKALDICRYVGAIEEVDFHGLPIEKCDAFLSVTYCLLVLAVSKFYVILY